MALVSPVIYATFEARMHARGLGCMELMRAKPHADCCNTAKAKHGICISVSSQSFSVVISGARCDLMCAKRINPSGPLVFFSTSQLRLG